MRHQALALVAISIGFSLSVPLASIASNLSPNKGGTETANSTLSCRTDLQTFNEEMETDGYWLTGSGYGYGYPMMGGYDSPDNIDRQSNANRYRTARPGYEVRTLVAAATILARNGRERACEDTLSTTRDIYKVYISQMKAGKMALADLPGWRARQLAAAQPIATRNVSFRSDQLIGNDVINTQNVALGSIDDLVMSPQTGKIAYLVIAHSGVFGIDKKYIPVPWGDFKITPNGSLIVLDTTEVLLMAAPMVSHDQFADPGRFDQQSKAVDGYWSALISNDGNSTSLN